MPNSNEIKRAQPERPILDCIADRWSPYVYEPRPVEREKLLTCLEAARWAASSYNEQPWSFLVAERTNTAEFERMLACLMEANQGWAKDAGVLLISVVCPTFARGNKPNRVAEHDVGLAAANFVLQATTLGLQAHQMAGVELVKARATYAIPETHAPFTAIALGYAGDPAKAAVPQLAERDLAPRTRKPIGEFVFSGRWQGKFGG